MRHRNTFLIESDSSGHELIFNGRKVSTFATLDAAEAEANKVANRLMAGARLKFELDFKWTLSDLEIRAATLETENGPAIH
jgi:hypothetical protein